MSNPALEILIILLLLVANGILSMSETAVIAARKVRLQQLAESGNARARAALELANHPNQFLATVQVGITLVGILAGAFGGATIAEEIATQLSGLPALGPYAETLGVGIVVLGITYLSLIIGELVPKQIALNNAEQIAAMVAAPMRVLATATAPLVRVLNWSTDLVIRLLGIKPRHEPVITPAEIKVLLQQGTETGVFEETEQDMIESVLNLDERRVGTCMTPRMQIVWLDLQDPPGIIHQKIANNPYSRFPVITGSPENVLGFVRAKDLLTQSLAAQPLALNALVRPPLYIPENMSTLKVLELFKQKGSHMALVIDEYGGIQGMVTLNDILEAIVGDVPAAGESAELAAVRREDGSWLLDGLLSIDKFKEIFELEKLPEEEHGNYQTVGGFVMTWLRSIPVTGQHFDWNHLHFEVVDMDGRRVDKIIVTRNQAKEKHPVAKR